MTSKNILKTNIFIGSESWIYELFQEHSADGLDVYMLIKLTQRSSWWITRCGASHSAYLPCCYGEFISQLSETVLVNLISTIWRHFFELITSKSQVKTKYLTAATMDRMLHDAIWCLHSTVSHPHKSLGRISPKQSGHWPACNELPITPDRGATSSTSL
jgi:hypothetical protein